MRNNFCMAEVRGTLLSCWLFFFLPLSTVNAAEGYEFDAVYTGDYWSNRTGGLQKAETYLDNLDIALEVDAEKVFNLKGGTFFAYLLYNNANTLSDTIVGDAQTLSNIDNTYVIRLEEFWYEQAFGERQSLKFGLYDLNSEFDVIEPATLFINSSHGIGPDLSQTGENGPSIFPVTSLSLRYFYALSDQFSFRVAVLDAVPGDPNHSRRNVIRLSGGDGALLAFEANYEGTMQRFGLGGWYYSEKSALLEGMVKRNDKGVYGIAQQTLYRGAGNENLTGWLRYGIADRSINQFDSYFGTGLVYAGFLTARPHDSLGLAVARAHASDSYRRVQASAGDNTEGSEINIELTYLAYINDRITLQPDVQYIINPDVSSRIDDALVMGLRFELTFF